MVLINNLVYEPKIKEINEEKQIIELLNEVSEDLSILRDGPAGSITSILKSIEKGEYQFKGDKGVVNVIDLSQAKTLINQYRKDSEGGCEPCKEKDYYKPNSDDSIKYCKLHELPKFVDSDISPRLKQFYEKGCKDKTPIFTKTIEQLLEYG